MDIPKIFESEYQFCRILWEHEPIKSRDLAAVCEERLGWKKTTTYTVIKRLSDRGVVKSENTIVTSLISQEQVREAEIDELVDKKFDGSVPAFLSAFVRTHSFTESELAELQRIIDNSRT